MEKLTLKENLIGIFLLALFAFLAGGVGYLYFFIMVVIYSETINPHTLMMFSLSFSGIVGITFYHYFYTKWFNYLNGMEEEE